ncbi:spore coat protein CotH [Salmonella enterica]|nr:spore coat protein CotH [Salmonella enterica]ECQ3583634.1 relaxase/mobilization nuclease domain-containing protein [Salmonella enterica]EGF1823843.1 relaxase/mobilization nuclease domain-containing protein [Salmonella enterica]EGF2625920.1 relaxase/mobilization nuclease domain-containing protein [Salmonella enterica]EGP2213128.1 relaxase/mobilization nuclease domain-containing protein [Salmonella enterica]
MGVYVDKEFRVKRKSSEAGRKSAFAHKVKNGGKNYQRNVQERINRKGASKEVVVKISGGAITRQGVRNSIDYMSRESELPVMNESGQVWKGDEIQEAKEHMIDRANDPQNVFDDSGKENKKITQNIVFSPPVSAKVKPEDLLESVRKTMQKKYPNHRFVLGYHSDKKEHPHVHVIFRIRDNDGKRADIRKKDLREIRTGFCEELKLRGYDVKATHKQQHGLNQSIKDAHNTAPKRQKDIYEVVDIGYDHYQNDKTKSKQHFIKLKTVNKGIEKTYWGADFGDLCIRENVKTGDLVKLKKLGQKEVKIPALDKNGVQHGWKTVHRNDWKLENLGVKGIDRNHSVSKEVRLNSPDMVLKQQQRMTQFTQQKAATLQVEQKLKVGIKLFGM